MDIALFGTVMHVYTSGLSNGVPTIHLGQTIPDEAQVEVALPGRVITCTLGVLRDRLQWAEPSAIHAPSEEPPIDEARADREAPTEIQE